MWLFEICTGRWFRAGQYRCHGYAGNGEGKNNPALQSIHDVGPIPVGLYRITGAMAPLELQAHHLAGPVLRLAAREGTETYGRGGFLIHGDSIASPGTASKGCPVADHTTRVEIYSDFKNGQDLIQVVAGIVPVANVA